MANFQHNESTKSSIFLRYCKVFYIVYPMIYTTWSSSYNKYFQLLFLTCTSQQNLVFDLFILSSFSQTFHSVTHTAQVLVNYL